MSDQYSELVEIIELSEELLKKIKAHILPVEMTKQLFSTAMMVNETLFGKRILDFQCDDKEDISAILHDFEKLISLWEEHIEIMRHGNNLDREFVSIYEYFITYDHETIEKNALARFMSYSEDYKKNFKSLPQRYTFLEGKLDIDEEDYSLITIYTRMMKDEIENFKWLYNKLADYRSKAVLLRIIRYWFTFDLNDLSDLHENIFKDYFDLDILSHIDDEIFVDCGAYTGDSILNFIHVCNGYKKIYGYEISPDTMIELKNNLKERENIILRQAGVGRENGQMFMEGDGVRASNKLGLGNEGILVDVVTLDEDIKEKVTTIKMDIEGAEIDALKGARNHIINEKPRLLICTYHKPSDLFEIPRLIDEMRDGYKLYLRFNGRGIWPCDHVLFAV